MRRDAAPLLGLIVGALGGAGIILLAVTVSAQWQLVGVILLAIAVAAGAFAAAFHWNRIRTVSNPSAQRDDPIVSPVVHSVTSSEPDAVVSMETHNAAELHRQYAEAWHELRTPMSSVIGYLELATERPTSDPKLAHYLAVALTNAEHVLKLTDDILAVGHGASATGLVVEQGVDVAAVAREALEMAEPLAMTNAVSLRLVQPNETRTVVADSRRVRQVIDNLLANAIKYTKPDTEVIVTVTNDLSDVVLSVTDYGYGMSEAEVKHMLTPYFRADTAVNTGQEGTGLGMGILHRIVASHGGAIRVDSKVGVGTTISVSIPQQQ